LVRGGTAPGICELGATEPIITVPIITVPIITVPIIEDIHLEFARIHP